MTTSYWADDYVEKKRTAEEAIGMIRPGQRVFIGSSSGEPQRLVKALFDVSGRFTDLEIVRLLALEQTPLTLVASRSRSQSLNIRSFYLGSGQTRQLAENARFITPMNLSALPKLFKTRQLPIHVAMIQTTPPDDFGWMSLGVSVDITLAAALSADLVIAQVNPKMPRTLGQSFLHANDVDAVVEHEEELLTIAPLGELESANTTGKLVSRLIDDGSTIQIGLGVPSQATLLALSEKKNLGIHTQYLTEDMMNLVARGVITNRRKGFNEGKLVCSSAIGSEMLYEFIHDNPSLDFRPSDYVNNPAVIARHNKMVAMNVAMAMDLTGQVAADALAQNHFSGVTGMLDFVRGANMAEGGKSIIMMTSTFIKEHRSRIFPKLREAAVVVPRGDVHYVVTEYGAVNLHGKSLQERAMAMISIAHPDFREDLFKQAKELGLLGEERTLNESLQGVYPVKLEEVTELEGETVTIRPSKPVDERRIQEHFYNLDKEDVISRFFHEKHSFVRDDLSEMLQTDYVKDMTIIALVGEFGFGRVIAVGEYLLNPASNMAEVAFTTHKKYQGKGIGKRIMAKLAEAARENGIAGLFAYTSPENKGMIRLFKSLPYKVKTTFEDDMILMKCRFDELADAG
ncbi:MAG: GNAT family N-acetyltransferase [Desulfococcaceae bacterium]